MKLLYIDIETAPLPDAEERIERFFPFDPEKVSLGNAKKPETVAAKIEEARINHVPDMLDKAQLNPALSYICAIGYQFANEEHLYIIGEREPDDAQLLEEFVDLVEHEETRLAGWNIIGFDAEFIWKRCWMNHMRPPRGFMRERGWTEIIDLMRVWCCHGYKAHAGLKDVARLLGVESPKRREMGDCDGKGFWKLWHGTDEQYEQARAYLAADVEETRAIGKVIL